MANQSSRSPNTPHTHLIQAKPDTLKVGMYVDLNCSWFKHPFASKTFKITSDNELAIIRGLGLSFVLVDPALSDSERLLQQDSDAVKDDGGVASKASVHAPPLSDSAPFHPTITRYQESLQQADTVYKETLSQSTKVLKDIGAGSGAGLMAAKEIIDRLADLVLDDATSSAMGSLLGAQDLADINSLHAMNVSVLSMLVGRQFDLAPDQMKTLGTAGLLHDIGEQRLPPHLREKNGRMTKEDTNTYRQHVEFGLRMLAKFPGLPDDVTDVVRHHHERIDGSGYPSQLQGSRLSLLSRILMVVDEYDCLINAPEICQNLTPTEALSKLYVTGKTTFSEEVIVALIQMLSVYPPGTVVELNDHSLGLVISINLHSRMRPLVILYDPSVDRENPNIVNLYQDTHRTIARSITRNELSREVSDYLNLSRWTGYFINSSMESLREEPAA